MTWLIEKLARHDRSTFDCGEPDLNRFVREFASQNQKENFGRTYVAVRQGESRVLGFFTLTVATVQHDALGAAASRGLPRYPVPVVRLGRLAVDRSAQGSGLGERLLVRAMEVALHVSDVVGIYAIEVNAKNASKRFYERYGFQSLLDDELHLYLSMKAVRKALSGS